MTPASPPTADLQAVGLDAGWSRTVVVPSHDGSTHHWHLLDRPGTDRSAATVLCIHGNPTSSILWTRLLAELEPRHRVIAPDLLSMGWSDRVAPRRYRERVADVVDLLDALGLGGPVWIVAQDWGGAIAMGVAAHHPERVAGLVLSNTGIAVPAGRRAPWLIRAAASAGLHALVTRSTPLFVRGTPWLPGRRIAPPLRRLLALPYRSRRDRTAVADFVADVPFDDRHPSAADLAFVADRLPTLDLPVRLVWGARDPVFDDSFADDLAVRFRDVEVHRFARSGHLTVLEESIAPIVAAALTEERSTAPTGPTSSMAPLWAEVVARSRSTRPAVVDVGARRDVTDADFAATVERAAHRLHGVGVRQGDRVAVLVPPSADLLAVVYACWRAGAVVVAVDSGLGVRGMGAALRSARPRHVVGVRRAKVAGRLLRWAPAASWHPVSAIVGAGGRPAHDGAHDGVLDTANAGDLAAVVFTSGATGPSKGVRYTHGQLCAQRDALRSLYGITDADRFVAAFAPFAVFGPALGITTCFADMDVAAPATLTARALDDACARSDATMVFASPAALANVAATAAGDHPALARVRLVLSAGAPVPLRTLRAISGLCPRAESHTPYGMTEVLPVADISLTDRERIGSGRGVCVGTPVAGCRVRIVRHDVDDHLVDVPAGSTGEVAVLAPWCSLGYDRLWWTQHRARPDARERWHRTGDVGHLDPGGHLWIEGRVVHLVHTVDGPVAPVPVEVAAESLPGMRRAAAVGVGPVGVQQLVVVVEHESSSEGLAPRELADSVRSLVAPTPVAMVWVTRSLPVDRRHNSKIDRTALALTMASISSGERR